MKTAQYEEMRRQIGESCVPCRRKMAALNVLFDVEGPPKSPGRPRKSAAAAQDVEAKKVVNVVLDRKAIEKKLCEICKVNSVRSDNQGCESCSRKACQKCRASHDRSLCKECEKLPI